MYTRPEIKVSNTSVAAADYTMEGDKILVKVSPAVPGKTMNCKSPGITASPGCTVNTTGYRVTGFIVGSIGNRYTTYMRAFKFATLSNTKYVPVDKKFGFPQDTESLVLLLVARLIPFT